MSPPSRGAWIEIFPTADPLLVSAGRPPRGGRGLKFLLFLPGLFPLMSPPSRGAWIEISMLSVPGKFSVVSPPSRGAWIEILAYLVFVRHCFVAPLAGGVD